MMILVRMHQSRHCRKESCYHSTRHKCSQFHRYTSQVNVCTISVGITQTNAFGRCPGSMAVFVPAHLSQSGLASRSFWKQEVSLILVGQSNYSNGYVPMYL
jgi:hypothetical protein